MTTSTIPAPSLLLARCKKHERLAYKELYEAYARAMFSISMRIVNDRDEAEDILQESFLKAFKDMSRFKSLPEFGAWMKRVVVNHSLGTLRKRKLEFIRLEDAFSEEEENLAEEKETDDMAYEIKTVIEAVQELPEGYRVILSLFLFEEYSHKEIATMLNISAGTSKSQYNRARKKLITLIQQKTLTHEKH